MTTTIEIPSGAALPAAHVNGCCKRKAHYKGGRLTALFLSFVTV